LPTKWARRFKRSARCLPYDVRKEHCGFVDFVLGDEGARKDARPSMDITDLYGVLNSQSFEGAKVLIDFTGIEQPALFFLLKCLHEQKRIGGVFGLYTEPLRYRTIPGLATQDEFDLTEEFISFRALPGFLRRHDPSRTSTLVVYMGFEGRRFVKVLEEVNPERGGTHAIFGLPAFQPGWQYLTLGSNQAAIEASRALLYRAEANNPFDAYEVAKLIAESYPTSQLVLAPIGTKPHAVGVALYAARHEDTLLIYDFPIKQRTFRTEGVGKTSVYALTELMLK